MHNEASSGGNRSGWVSFLFMPFLTEWGGRNLFFTETNFALSSSHLFPAVSRFPPCHQQRSRSIQYSEMGNTHTHREYSILPYLSIHMSCWPKKITLCSVFHFISLLLTGCNINFFIHFWSYARYFWPRRDGWCRCRPSEGMQMMLSCTQKTPSEKEAGYFQRNSCH